MLITKKHIITLISILSIIGYGYLAFAVIPPATTLDPVTDFPGDCTGPTDPNCVISQAWEQDLVNNYVFKTTGNVGIGTDVPSTTLQVDGDTTFQYLHNATSNEELAGHTFNFSPNPSALVENSRYSAIQNNFFYDGTFDITNDSALSTQTNNFVYQGTGTLSSVSNGEFNLLNLDSGTLEDARILTGTIFNSTSGNITSAKGIEFSIANTGSGIIQSTQGFRTNIVNLGSGSIGDAQAYAITSIGPGGPGITAQRASGFIISRDTTNLFPAISGNEVFGVFIGPDSLEGANDEYGLYIRDGQNYLSNGVRIGSDDPSYQISNTALGSSTNPLYIGNEQITTSVSDKRLKTNIEPASENALDFVNNLSVTSFDWLSENKRSDQGRVPFGFIAQEIDAIAPYYVSKTNNPDDIMAVRFGDMVPALTKAIQELDLKLENIQSASSTVVVSSGFSLDSIRDWLGDVGNGIQRLFVRELCIIDESGNECLSAQELRQLKSMLQNSSFNNSGSFNTIPDNNFEPIGTVDESDNEINDEIELVEVESDSVENQEVEQSDTDTE